MKKKFQLMKVFDCQDMPGKIKESFFRIFDDQGNDVYVTYQIAGERFKYTLPNGVEVDEEDSEWAKDKKVLDAWLIKNGASAPKSKDSSGEEVLINHWW